MLYIIITNLLFIFISLRKKKQKKRDKTPCRFLKMDIYFCPFSKKNIFFFFIFFEFFGFA